MAHQCWSFQLWWWEEALTALPVLASFWYASDSPGLSDWSADEVYRPLATMPGTWSNFSVRPTQLLFRHDSRVGGVACRAQAETQWNCPTFYHADLHPKHIPSWYSLFPFIRNVFNLNIRILTFLHKFRKGYYTLTSPTGARSASQLTAEKENGALLSEPLNKECHLWWNGNLAGDNLIQRFASFSYVPHDPSVYTGKQHATSVGVHLEACPSTGMSLDRHLHLHLDRQASASGLLIYRLVHRQIDTWTSMPINWHLNCDYLSRLAAKSIVFHPVRTTSFFHVVLRQLL